MGIDKQTRKDLIDYQLSKGSFNTRLADFAKSFGKSKKHISVVSNAVDETYGEGKFRGNLPEDQSELVVGGIYMADSPDKSYKILYEIDEKGNTQLLRNIFG